MFDERRHAAALLKHSCRFITTRNVLFQNVCHTLFRPVSKKLFQRLGKREFLGFRPTNFTFEAREAFVQIFF